MYIYIYTNMFIQMVASHGRSHSHAIHKAELSPLGEASAGHGWTLFWCSKQEKWDLDEEKLVFYPLVMTVTVRHGFSMALIEIDS